MKKSRNKVISQINTNENQNILDNRFLSEDLDESTILYRQMNDGFYDYYTSEESGDLFDTSSVSSAGKKKLKKKRDSIDQSMPEKLTSERLEKILNKQDVLVTNLKTEKNRLVSKLGDTKSAQSEIDEINEVLRLYLVEGQTVNEGNDVRYDETSMEKIVKRLRFKKARDLSQVLVNENSKSDSPEMKAVKYEVLRLSYYLEEIRDKKVTKKLIEEACTYYATACKYCEDYLSSKKQNARYEKVNAVWESIAYEMDSLLLVRDQDFSTRKNYTMGELLGMSEAENGDVQRDVHEFKSEEDYNPENRTAPYAQGTSNALIVFDRDYSLDDVLAAAGNKTSEKKKIASQNYELWQGLKQFVPGQVMVRDVVVMGKKVSILQNADNELFVLDKHDRIPLAKTAREVFNEISDHVLLKGDLYDIEAARDVVKAYMGKTDITRGEHTTMRNNLTEYLANKLGLSKDAFNNVLRKDMMTYIWELGNKKKTIEQVKSAVEQSKNQMLVNGVELTELMELDAQQDSNLSDNVSMYEIQAQEDNNDWTEEEKSVKNLMAEFVFSSDTHVMDKNAQNPKEFVRSVLLSNIDAVKILIKNNDNEKDLITTIMEKMSLDKVTGEANDNFAETVAKSLKDIVSYLRSRQFNNLASALRNVNDDELNANLEQTHNSMQESIKASSDIMQANVRKIVDAMFEKTESDENANDTLEGILKNATRTEAGQGLFVKTVLKNYFSKMNPIDQRAMLASALRSCRKVNINNISDRALHEEIANRKLVKYKSITEKTFDKLTEDDHKLIDEYRKQKEALMVGANYFAGLIRGAGPLLHKMLQGIPEETLPSEIRLALRDVKSKLPPIPDRVVKTQLNAMIERSNNAITRIEVLKNLGAASVGQTFKCRIYGPELPKEGKNVVIKLLRPDCQNRMDREKDIMLDCASQVNVGMYETYKGQLTNYYMELDLSKEYKNIEDGQIYNGKYGDVVSEKVSTIIKPTPNSLMIEEAPGRTLDDILLDSAKLRDDTYKRLHEPYLNQYGETEYRPIIDINEETIQKTKEARLKLIDHANDLIKKRDIMANITKVWIEEALFGSGYYHADLHAGNILLSDSTGTLIDFGNAVQFTAEQKASITKMMTAAASSRVEMFYEEFNKLLDWNDEKFKAFYTEDVKRQVKKAFEDILNMGDDEQAGERISAALIKASELGVKLPPSIYNFSQGQLRLQKSIDDINREIQEIDRLIYDNDKAMRDIGKKVLGLSAVVEKATIASKSRKDFAANIKQQRDAYLGIDKKSFVDALLDNTYVKGDLSKGIATVDKRSDFNKNILGELHNYEAKITSCYNKGEMPTDFKVYRKKWVAFKTKWTTRIEAVKNNNSLKEEDKEKQISDLRIQQEKEGYEHLTDYYPNDGGNALLMSTGFSELLPAVADAMRTLDDTKMEPLLSFYEDQISVAIDIDRKIRELRKLQDDDELDEKTKEKLTTEIYKLFTSYNEAKNKNNAVSLAFNNGIRYISSFEKNKKEMEMMFKETTTIMVNENEEEDEDEEDVKEEEKKEVKLVEKPLGPLLEQKLDEFHEIAKTYAPKNGEIWKMDNMPAKVEKKARKLLKECTKLHLEITKIQLKRFCEGRYDKDIDVKSFDFCDVMKVIIQKNFGKFTANVGIGNLLKIGGMALLNKIMGKG